MKTLKINSLFTKITIIFILAFLLLCGHFLAFVKFQDEQQHQQVVNSHKKLSSYFFQNRLSKKEIIDYVSSLDYEVENNFREVLSNAKIVSSGKRDFETLFYKENYYFHVTIPKFRILFRDLSIYERSYYIYIIFTSLLILLVFIYIWLLNSLKPLYDLKVDIRRFAKGDLEIDCKSDKKDEIAEVSNEFDKAVKKIKMLNDSRQLFLRTVMHELKTPIAKGRIVSELIDDEKQKNRMTNIFSKMDYLVNDFANIERIISQNYKLNIQIYKIEDIYKNSIKLFIDNVHNNIELKVDKNSLFEVDIELFSLVFKNLIDNAFKYSDDGKIKINQNNNGMVT